MSVDRNSEPRVLNKRKDGVPKGAVYVGRPSKWGNPFLFTDESGREYAIRAYEEWLFEDGPWEDLGELTGKDLVCWCAPAACHADVLVRCANAPILANLDG